MTFDDIQTILAQHTTWLSTNGTAGQSANLSNLDISNLDLTETIKIPTWHTPESCYVCPCRS